MDIEGTRITKEGAKMGSGGAVKLIYSIFDKKV
jgi:hypothetical protein